MNRLFSAEVLSNVPVGSHFMRISVRPTATVKRAAEGQFYMFEAARTYDPLLKRPFSLFRNDGDNIEFLYRIIGKGTSCISKIAPGTEVQLLGPLGNSYPEPAGDFVVVTGGIGLASVYSLIEKYPGRAHVYYGARNCEDLILVDELGKIAKSLVITTDDGSSCRRGFVTEPLAEFIDTESFGSGPLPVYACGPMPMMRELERILRGRGITCFVSLEEYMACGVGACLGCVTKAAEGYKCVCKDGPVFRIEDIIWD